ncbi:GNAT family N-acetyltransferase [Paenibacillus barcinonensis]|uniref:GNAT family N-acetyltransferase n=1 Tax=Paenibacillus barcinonensis TaxID=198119 RepID=A0A2V4VLU4_PAEBA|nr:GNAT family N-acetyltransferase [Paenibacillus barcinonensis]PYE47252.1 putative N-acetyltransferase YhbS [Paenibacillus barcinonensis]QKS58591.1 GNAT family N-acetyltransferase [Paenibacillus barcinonensis]
MTTAAMTIVPATPADHDEIVDILAASYAEYQNTFEPSERWEAYVKDIRESVDNPHLTELWIARIDEQIVGTVQLFETAHKAYPNFELPIDYPFIRLLGVAPDWRGHGIARKLLQRCVESTKEMGKTAVYLYTGGQMLNAIRLYERFGFVEDTEFSSVSSGGNAICYRYDIGE